MANGDAREPADEEIVRGIRAGDRDAFTLAFRRHQRDVYRFARHMTSDSAIADDVTQDAFLALMRHPDRFDAARGSLRTYLLGIARHAIANRLRERRWWGDADDPVDAAAAVGDDPHETLCRAQEVARVQAAVALLPPAFRDTLVLCDLLGLSYDEAAASLGCPVGTVRSRLFRARQQLGSLLRTQSGVQMEGVTTRCLA